MQASVLGAGPAGVRPMSDVGLRAFVRRHRLASYLAVAAAVSWSWWVAMALDGQIVRPGGTTSHFPGLFGPMIAAFAVAVLADGLCGARDLAGRMLRWRTSPRWYALSVAPSLVFATAIMLLAITGGPVPTVGQLARYSGLPEVGLPAVILLAFLGNGFGEEVGWRGFAMPTLRTNHGFLRAAVTVGVIWALWHVPSFGVIETYRTMGLAIVPIFAIGLGSGAIVFGWLYERSGGSILIVALAHLSLNMATATEAGRGLPQALVTTAIVVWAVLIVVAELRGPGGASNAFARAGRTMTTRLLRSRLGGGLARSTTVISYRGRTSGRLLSTPVEYVREGSRVSILVAAPERKQWWRNVRANDQVSLLIEGAAWRGRATVVAPPDAARALARYVAERPRSSSAVRAGAFAVIVELTDAAD